VGDVDMSFVNFTEEVEVELESEIFGIEEIEVIEVFRECDRE
jgi:hypothetical protein